MKALTINYLAPASVKLTGKQLEACHTRWKDSFGINDPFEDMPEEDILIQAEALGFIQLPEGWKT